MSTKRYKPEQIIGKLREAEVALAQGETTGQVCRTLGIAGQTFYQWRREYGGLKIEQARRLKALEQDNTRLGPDGFGCTNSYQCLPTGNLHFNIFWSAL
jgi:transposase-like protein